MTFRRGKGGGGEVYHGISTRTPCLIQHLAQQSYHLIYIIWRDGEVKCQTYPQGQSKEHA